MLEGERIFRFEELHLLINERKLPPNIVKIMSQYKVWLYGELRFEDFMSLKHINDPAWKEITNGTLLVRDSARLAFNLRHWIDYKGKYFNKVGTFFDNMLNGDVHESMLICTDDFSILDGNHRAIASMLYLMAKKVYYPIKVLVGIKEENPFYKKMIEELKKIR